MFSLTLTGRIKELINRGGEKISPVELDGALLSIEGVTEAVAFGVPDRKVSFILLVFDLSPVLVMGRFLNLLSERYSMVKSHGQL
jgi:acyl-CoA synthetase (AMP-forming)/AMP-acid ligase II